MIAPVVSVITPVFNAEPFLRECVDSVISQSFPDWEMFLVDDGSSDGSAALAEEYAWRDGRIHALRNERNMGTGLTRNQGILRAQGRFIAFLDADDSWHANKLEHQLAFMARTGAALSYTSYEQIGPDNAPIGRVVRALPRVTWRTLLRTNYIGCSTAMYSREALGTRLMPDLRKRQDYGLWLDILRDIDAAQGLDEILVRYRVSGASLSSNKWSAARFNWIVYRRHANQGVMASAWYFLNYVIRGIFRSL